MYANGVRKAREDKGYGRAALAKALSITAAEYWVAEFVLEAGSPAAKAFLARVAGLPSIKKDGKATPAPTTKRVNKATPKDSSSQADIDDLV
jgi:hypothetical protein